MPEQKKGFPTKEIVAAHGRFRGSINKEAALRDLVAEVCRIMGWNEPYRQLLAAELGLILEKNKPIDQTVCLRYVASVAKYGTIPEEIRPDFLR